MSLEEIEKIYTNLSEVELIYKPKVKVSDLPTISTAAPAYEVLKYNWNAGRIEMVEEFKVVFLNRANKAIGIYHASIGGTTGTVADPRLILIAALKVNAVSMILAHNHPSGNLKPSRADEEITQKIKGAAQFLDIKVLDHLIITAESFYSFAEEGIM